MGCYGQTHFLHGVEGWLLGDQPVHEPCQMLFQGEWINSAEELDWDPKGDRIRELGRKQQVGNAIRRGQAKRSSVRPEGRAQAA